MRSKCSTLCLSKRSVCCWEIGVRFEASRTFVPGDAFLLVFSFDSEESFEQIPALLDEIHALNSKPHRRICIVGNKADLVKGAPVNRQLAESLVSLDWELSYVEVSAKENRNFDDLLAKTLGEVARESAATEDADKKKRKTSLPPSVLKCRNALVKRNSCIGS